MTNNIKTRLLIGTASDEKRIGQAEIKTQLQRDFSQSESGEIQIISFLPTPEQALWTTAICNTTITINSTSHVFENLRCTIMIAEENQYFKIAHMHASFPDIRSPQGSSFPIIFHDKPLQYYCHQDHKQMRHNS